MVIYASSWRAMERRYCSDEWRIAKDEVIAIDIK